jgi:hypothetical protein
VLTASIIRAYHPDNRGSDNLWNIDQFLWDYTAQHPRKVIFKKVFSVLKQDSMKTYGEVETALRPFSTSALNGCEWSASHFDRFSPGETVPYPMMKRLGGTQSQSGRGDEDKNLWSQNRYPVFLPVASDVNLTMVF